ncbi:hypothetical protein ACTXT7_017276 [Hymenolepis weldensis]
MCYKKEQKEGKAKDQHSGIITAIVVESKPVSKVNAIGKTENADLPCRPEMNVVLCSIYLERIPRIKRKKKDRFYLKWKGVMIVKLKAVLGNFWTSSNPRLDGISPVETLMGRSNHPITPLKKDEVAKV